VVEKEVEEEDRASFKKEEERRGGGGRGFTLWGRKTGAVRGQFWKVVRWMYLLEGGLWRRWFIWEGVTGISREREQVWTGRVLQARKERMEELKARVVRVAGGMRLLGNERERGRADRARKGAGTRTLQAVQHTSAYVSIRRICQRARE
jgi:hypothetical protein